MEQFRRQLERIQIRICIFLLVLLFGGLLVLPWIGQCIWIAIIMAIYIRLMLVISRREELLERINLPSEDIERSVWCDNHEGRAVRDH